MVPIFAGLGGFSIGAIGGAIGGYFYNDHFHDKKEEELKKKLELDNAEKEAAREGMAVGQKEMKEKHVQKVEALTAAHKAEI